MSSKPSKDNSLDLGDLLQDSSVEESAEESTSLSETPSVEDFSEKGQFLRQVQQLVSEAKRPVTADEVRLRVLSRAVDKAKLLQGAYSRCQIVMRSYPRGSEGEEAAKKCCDSIKTQIDLLNSVAEKDSQQ